MVSHVETFVKHLKYNSWDFRPLSGFFYECRLTFNVTDIFRKQTCFWWRDAEGHLQTNRSYLGRKYINYFWGPDPKIINDKIQYSGTTGIKVKAWFFTWPPLHFQAERVGNNLKATCLLLEIFLHHCCSPVQYSKEFHNHWTDWFFPCSLSMEGEPFLTKC